MLAKDGEPHSAKDQEGVSISVVWMFLLVTEIRQLVVECEKFDHLELVVCPSLTRIHQRRLSFHVEYNCLLKEIDVHKI